MHRQMRYFIAVVETNSFFEAGEACHISQSAISQQIRALEDELQVKLLERHSRKFSVTPAGVGFYPCDEDMPADGGAALVPLMRGDSPMSRKMFAFWPHSSDISLQREFTDLLRRNIK